jgi:hypothetical protein
MRYKDLIEALQETDWDRIKSYANVYGKKHGINPKYILGLFNHESMKNGNYHPVGDQTFLQTTKNPNKWIKAYGKEPEAHMSYGPGHFSVRALTKVQNSHPELKIGEKNVKDITWNDLKANDALAAELSVIHFRDLFNDPANKGNNDGETLLNAYTAKQGSYRGKDKNSPKFGNKFIASINKFADKPFAVATIDDPWKSKWSDERKKEWEAGQEKIKQRGEELYGKLSVPDEWSQVATIDDPEQVTSTPAEQEKIKQRGKEIYGKLSDPDEWKQMAKNAWDKTVDPEQWKQTIDTILGNEPESDFMRKAREKALAKKTASQSSKVAGPKTPRSIKPSNTEPLSTQPSNTKESKTFKNYLDEANSKYIVSMNPNDKKWYVMGHVGNNKWMPVSNGFKNKAQAQKWAKSQDKVDIAARGEISGA